MTASLKTKMNIEINNITEAQKLAIESMLAVWENLGNVGSSRKVSFFADGDGNFRPKILVDDQFAGQYILKNGKAVGDDFNIDYDEIAWEIEQ